MCSSLDKGRQWGSAWVRQHCQDTAAAVDRVGHIQLGLRHTVSRTSSEPTKVHLRPPDHGNPTAGHMYDNNTDPNSFLVWFRVRVLGVLTLHSQL